MLFLLLFYKFIINIFYFLICINILLLLLLLLLVYNFIKLIYYVFNIKHIIRLYQVN